jgi:hypothetical protein
MSTWSKSVIKSYYRDGTSFKPTYAVGNTGRTGSVAGLRAKKVEDACCPACPVATATLAVAEKSPGPDIVLPGLMLESNGLTKSEELIMYKAILNSV